MIFDIFMVIVFTVTFFCGLNVIHGLTTEESIFKPYSFLVLFFGYIYIRYSGWSIYDASGPVLSVSFFILGVITAFGIVGWYHYSVVTYQRVNGKLVECCRFCDKPKCEIGVNDD